MRCYSTTVLAASIALLSLGSGVARATPACGGSSFATCASVTLTKTLLSNGNVRIRIEVLNQAGLGGTYDGLTFTRIGLSGVPEHARYVPGSLVVGGEAVATDWRLATLTEDDDSIPEERRMRPDMRGVRLRQGVSAGLHQRQPASFEFDLSDISFDEINTRNWEIHAESADGACATDMVAHEGTLGEARRASALCSAVLTPEPNTLVLFATGVAGLGCVRWVRRRRKK